MPLRKSRRIAERIRFLIRNTPVRTLIFRRSTQKLDNDLTMLGNKLTTSLISESYREMEERNFIKWSEYNEYTELTIPSGEIWMSESEMVDLFRVFIPKLRNAIKALYKEKLERPYEGERIIRMLASRLNSYQARAVRKEMMERISRDHKPFEVILTATTGKGN